MAYRLDIKRILSMNFFHDLPQIMLGCALAAIATDLFLIPNGLAAGGVTGLATIIQAVGASRGVSLPGVEGMNRGIRCHRPVQVTNGVPLTKEAMSVTAESSETRETPEAPLPPVAQPTIRIGT